jgi:hypothetical protein
MSSLGFFDPIANNSKTGPWIERHARKPWTVHAVGQRVFNIEEQAIVDVDDELLVAAPTTSTG